MYTVGIEAASQGRAGRYETEVFRSKLRTGQEATEGTAGEDEYYDGHDDDDQDHHCLGED